MEKVERLGMNRFGIASTKIAATTVGCLPYTLKKITENFQIGQ